MTEIDNRMPKGELSLQTITMPADTNWSGDVFGGWLVSQMDLAGAIHCERATMGRCATVVIQEMRFLKPVKVGDVVSCYTFIERVGHTSVQFHIEVWTHNSKRITPYKVAEGTYIYVLIDAESNKRQVPESLKNPN